MFLEEDGEDGIGVGSGRSAVGGKIWGRES
jgi:hypothetical protein